jgi:hypothetical protein
MSAQEQIAKLQSLLDRIKRNSVQPRGGAPVRASVPTPIVAPVPFAAPAAPAPLAPPAPHDASVDDLLSASVELSPPPVEVDVPLDTLPPVAEVDAEPIPLVSAPKAPEVPALEDPFNLEQEVSEVRFTTGEREPSAEVTVAAIEAEAEAEPLATEELSEDDLVEVTEATAAPSEVASDLDFEEPPASSQRKVASSMDEALAAAAAQLDAEREVPIKTPPPESGPQEAPPPAGMNAPAAPDVDALLGQELDIPTHARGHEGPTTEQLGQTIDLEEGAGPSLELAEQQVASAAPAAFEELEVALPGRDAGGGYHDDLQPPPEALNDLEAHRRRLEDDIPPPPESLAQLPSVQPGPNVEIVQAAGPEIVARPIPVGSPETFSTVRDSFSPSSFVQLLDASLALSGE